MSRNLLRMSFNKRGGTPSTRPHTLLLLCLLHLAANDSLVSGLSCYHCGELSSNARAIEDCSGTITVQQCDANEACVVFKRLYVKGSESIRGCYPNDKSLPGLSGSLIVPSPNCEFQPKSRSPVKVCMCTTDLCNANDYNIHLENANRLFAESRTENNVQRNNDRNPSRNLGSTSSSNWTLMTVTTLLDGASRIDLNSMKSVPSLSSSSSANFFVDKVANQILREGAVEREESLWQEIEELDQSKRLPRQARTQATSRTPVVECYSCGSLFNRDGAPCQNFDRSNSSQRTTCKSGEGCLLYTWQKSATEIGSFRECFSTSFKLGQASSPIKVTPKCELQRTQSDPASSIRACICTSNFCNDINNINNNININNNSRNPKTTEPAIAQTTNAPSDAGPVDCRWTDFTEWSDCSLTCGPGGVQTRERSIALLARRGGKPCQGESKETRPCNLQKCPPARFGVPPVVCQSLNVLGATYANCDGQYTVTNERVEWATERPVFKHVNKDRYIFWNAHGLGWSIGKKDYLKTGSHWHRSGLDTEEPWQGTWSGGVFVECVGKQEGEEPSTVTRPVTPPPTQQQQQQQQTNSRLPPKQQQTPVESSEGPTNCFWSSFGEWSRCSVSCGSGNQQRKRMVLQPARNGGLDCAGEAIESRPCSQVACPVDCEWNEFGDWTECSASCGGGIQRRRRTVGVRAANGGLPCRGKDIESRPCNEDQCKIDCRWSELSRWTKCSQSCGPGGVQTRTRFVVQEPIGPGARLCEGEHSETRECPDIPDCPTTTTATIATTTTTVEPTTSFSSTLSEVTTESFIDTFNSGEILESGEEFSSEERKVLDESFIEKLLNAINDVTTDRPDQSLEPTESTPEEVVEPALSNACCNRIVVKAFGPAKDDQSLYLGTYNQITNYNGKAAYEKEGSDQLYIYFFMSQSDQLSLWVIGPELGKFIAGLRNDGAPACVHDATEKWRYASRAGLWKEDDPTLQVKCYSPEDDVDSLAFGVRKTTTRLPINKANNAANTPRPTNNTPRPTNNAANTQRPASTANAAESFEDEDEDFLDEIDPIETEPVINTSIFASVDCQWSDYGPWSACSATCDRGTQTRFRTVLKKQKPGGKQCSGSARESRSCNLQSCFNEIASNRRPAFEATTRQPFVDITTNRPALTTTTARAQLTTSRPRPAEPRRDGRVKCFACGSLFSTDAPDCQQFDFQNPSQQKTCEKGEACLWYTYQKAANERAVIRECFSTSILLGAIDNPIEPQEQCNPLPVEDGDDSIIACICTDDFCNGYKDGDNNEATGPNVPTKRPVATTTTSTTPAPRARTTTSRSRTERPQDDRIFVDDFEANNFDKTTERGIIRPATRPTAKPNNPVAAPGGTNSNPNKVLCHQCGSLFSGASGNAGCTEFDESKSDQRSYCKPGEACLWYSWQKSDNEISTIRECFSPSILLGPITNPLTVKTECRMQDISETPGSSIMACLCDSDLCNAKEAARGGNPVALPQVAGPPQTSAQRVVATTTTTRRPPPTQSPSRTVTQPPARRPISQLQPDDDDLSAEELVALTELGRAPGSVPEQPKSRPQESQNRPAVTQRTQTNSNAPAQTGGALRCFSCGSLLDPSRQCDTFNPKDATQLQTCGQDEACLLYTWKKSNTEKAVLRECFPISVLLGNVNDPLTPEDECRPRDISEPGTSGVTACLCTTSFCNVGDGPAGEIPAPSAAAAPAKSEPLRTTTIRTEIIPTTKISAQQSRQTTTKPPRRPQPLQEQSQASIRLPQQQLTDCPRGFELVGFGCYTFSAERMGWIEAKKMCELKEARLIVIETEKERDDILEHIIATQGKTRSRFEFWTAGNDIETENVWVWSGQSSEIVPEFGWIEQPLPSAEENCLTWDITVSRGNFSPRGRQVTVNSGQRFTEGWHSDSCCNSVRYICELA